MTTVPFDTLALARKLEAAGFPPQQAQDVSAALAEVMAADLATKQDIRDIRAEIALATRDLRIWTAGLAGVVIAVLPAPRFFGRCPRRASHRLTPPPAPAQPSRHRGR